MTVAERGASHGTHERIAGTAKQSDIHLSDANLPLYLLKIALTIVTFFALCASLIFIVLPAGHLWQGDTSTKTFVLLSIALAAVVLSAIAFFLATGIGRGEGVAKVRLLNALALSLAVGSLVLTLLTLVNLRSSLVANLFTGIAAVICAYGAFTLNNRVKRLSVTSPVTLPKVIPTRFKVYRSRSLALRLAAASIICGGAAYLMFLDKHTVEVFMVIVAGLSLVATIVAIRKLNEPALIIDDRGIFTPEFALVSWPELDRVFVDKREHRSGTAHILVMEVEDSRKFLQRRNAFSLWLRQFRSPIARNYLEISLDFLRYKPDFIAAVIAHFRKAYAASIGVNLKYGDLSMDTRFTEISQLMDELKVEQDASKLESGHRRLQQLLHEGNEEIRDGIDKLRKSRPWIYGPIVLALLFIAFITWLRFSQ